MTNFEYFNTLHSSRYFGYKYDYEYETICFVNGLEIARVYMVNKYTRKRVPHTINYEVCTEDDYIKSFDKLSEAKAFAINY